MKIFEKAKGFIIGFIVSAMLFGGVTAIAVGITANTTTAKVMVNGKNVAVDAYNINDSNYFKLRDFCSAVDIGVWFDGTSNTIHIETDKGYDANYTGTAQPSQTPDTIPVSKIQFGEPTVIYGTEVCYFKQNSANGIDVSWMTKNPTGKRVKYYYVTLHMENAVGDPAYCEIKKQSDIIVNYIGPLEVDADMVVSGVVAYSAACSKITIGNVQFEYFDGTTENVWCGHVLKEKY